MGARLYNPTTGRLLSRDPVPGGNDNTYTYPADPVNVSDLDGRFGIPNFVKKAASSAGKLAWKYKYDIALTAVGGGGLGLAYRSYRTARAINTLRTATKGRNVVTKTPKCTVRYCFGSGHGPVQGPHVHRQPITKQGPQRPTVKKMTGRDARKGLKDLQSGRGTTGNARRRR